jgi:hypothetical protein
MNLSEQLNERVFELTGYDGPPSLTPETLRSLLAHKQGLLAEPYDPEGGGSYRDDTMAQALMLQMLLVAWDALGLAMKAHTGQNCSPGNEGIAISAMEARDFIAHTVQEL